MRQEFEMSVHRRNHENKGGWIELRNNIMEAGKEVCGIISGKRRRKGKETWWWNVEVQRAIKEKKEKYKKWQRTREEEDRAAYRERKREAKTVVANAKIEASE